MAIGQEAQRDAKDRLLELIAPRPRPRPKCACRIISDCGGAVELVSVSLLEITDDLSRVGDLGGVLVDDLRQLGVGCVKL
jgi:hypothetical protein